MCENCKCKKCHRNLNYFHDVKEVLADSLRIFSYKSSYKLHGFIMASYRSMLANYGFSDPEMPLVALENEDTGEMTFYSYESLKRIHNIKEKKHD